MGIQKILWIIIISGFFGGVSSYVTFSIYEVSGSFKQKLDLRIFQWFSILVLNGVVGICGAFAIQILVLGMRFYENVHDQASDYVFLIAICVIAGFGARSFLFRLTAMFEAKIGELDEKADKALTTATELQDEVSADNARRQIINDLTQRIIPNARPEQLEYAANLAKLQFQKNPNDGEFAIIAGRALRRLDRYQEAIDVLTEYIDRRGLLNGPDKQLSDAHYNRACYYSLLYDRAKIERYLTHIFTNLQLSLRYSSNPSEDKIYARQDPDLAPVRDEPRFNELIGTDLPSQAAAQ